MTFTVDLFWSFRSPYSYLAIPKTQKLVAEYDVTVNLRPVYPLAVRVPGFFKRADPRFAFYVVLDSRRVAEREGIPFRFPQPDPIVQNMTTLEVAAEQPYIHRLTRLVAAAQQEGRALAFVSAVAPVLWNGSIKNWHEGDHLAGAAARAGLNMAELDAEADADAETLDAEVAANQAALEAAGHWGVPTLVFQGEPFFGQDRIDLALWRMEQAGLEKRG